MTLNQLMIFAAAAKQLSITRASEELHVSQPSVSEQLKLLEEQFKVKLYKRSGRGIELTEDGKIFLSYAKPILTQIERLKERLHAGFPGRESESLVVGGSYSPSAFFLPLPAGAF